MACRDFSPDIDRRHPFCFWLASNHACRNLDAYVVLTQVADRQLVERGVFLERDVQQVGEQCLSTRVLDQVFLVEQNRDAQMRSLLVNECGIDPARFISVLNYDGTPITARFIINAIAERLAVTEYNSGPAHRRCPECGTRTPPGYCWQVNKDSALEQEGRAAW